MPSYLEFIKNKEEQKLKKPTQVKLVTNNPIPQPLFTFTTPALLLVAVSNTQSGDVEDGSFYRFARQAIQTVNGHLNWGLPYLNEDPKETDTPYLAVPDFLIEPIIVSYVAWKNNLYQDDDFGPQQAYQIIGDDFWQAVNYLKSNERYVDDIWKNGTESVFQPNRWGMFR